MGYNRAEIATKEAIRNGEMHGWISKGLRRTVLSPNHDRDFRLRSVFNGSDVEKRGIRARIAELGANGSSVKLHMAPWAPLLIY